MRQLIRAQLAAGETSLVGPGAVPLRVVRESERLSAHVRALIRQQIDAGETSLVGPGAVPLAVVRESERLSAHVRSLLPRLEHPVQVQHAREDEICRLASVRRAIAGVPTGLMSLHVAENSYHMITADNDRHLVADRLSAFMQGLDACTLDSVPFAHDISSEFDVAEAAAAP